MDHANSLFEAEIGYSLALIGVDVSTDCLHAQPFRPSQCTQFHIPSFIPSAEMTAANTALKAYSRYLAQGVTGQYSKGTSLFTSIYTVWCLKWDCFSPKGSQAQPSKLNRGLLEPPNLAHQALRYTTGLLVKALGH
jgi:hypothetical protein